MQTNMYCHLEALTSYTYRQIIQSTFLETYALAINAAMENNHAIHQSIIINHRTKWAIENHQATNHTKWMMHQYKWNQKPCFFQ